jgi:hypothetical protein
MASTPDPAAKSPHGDSPLGEKLAQLLVLFVLCAAASWLALYKAVVADPDIWWHLSTGDWIFAHHVVPHVDPFSSTTLNHPWQAYSWLFELLVAKLYKLHALAGIEFYTGGMLIAIAAALYHLLRRCQRDFTLTIALTALALYTMTGLFSPRPWHFSILCFILLLDILLHARRSGNTRGLLWLPFIFLIWANTHIQFIDGLLILALALAESLIAPRIPSASAETKLKPRALIIALVACLAATCINPYGITLYKTAYELAAQAGAMSKISELAAIPFRTPPEFLLLFLTLGASAALVRRRGFSLFETGLLIFSAFLAFRSQRDLWMLAITAVVLLTSALPENSRAPHRIPRFAIPLVAALAILTMPLQLHLMHRTNPDLEKLLAEGMPVRAVDFARQHRAAAPVFTTFEWGGFCLHQLQLPVTIDGRAALHGDAQLDLSQQTWNGGRNWSANPDLRSAGVVIGPADSALTQLLRSDPGFQLVYEDSLAAVFIPSPAQSTK